jgi:putative DNA primase/helicase
LNFNNIPDDLRNSHQWILWRSEVREGKPTKVPYQVSGEMAQSNNKRTWSTFYTAVHAYRKGGYDGIGFMFSKDDPFIGIDIDHCMNDGEFSPLADEVIEMMDSYTELSPSGDGIHIIVKGDLPIEKGTGKKNPELGLEVYRHGRYFTFTGDSQNVYEVVERTDELGLLFQKYFQDKKPIQQSSPVKQNNSIDHLSDSELWEKMFNSKNGSNIKSLFQGNLINGDHSSTDLALCNHLAFWTNKDAAKMDSMFRESNLMRDKWDEERGEQTYGAMTIDNAIYSTSSTIADFQEEKPYQIYIGDEEESKESETKEKPFFRLTELGNAERIAHYHGKNLKYCNEYEWLIWNGKRWEFDSKREIEQIAAKTFRELYNGNDAEKGWAKRCEKRSIRMNSILDTRPLVSVKKTDFDSHEYLFNCGNGVIDLKTGELHPHNRDYLFTKISNIEYDDKAECPNWKRFLESIFKNDDGTTNQEIIDFLQKAIGYTLTGDISEQVMFFLYGTGRNGKSTFINTIQSLLGDYGRQTNSDTFIKKKNDNSVNNDIARLDGSRFVSAVESEEGQQLSESLVKQITGGEKISARFLRQEFFEFTPEFKVFFTTNHKPIVKGTDEGIWRRIRLVPFTVTIPKEQIDKELPKKLEKEMPGILRWAVEGGLKWQREGLGEPSMIRSATESYREEMDILGPFLNEVCTIDPIQKVEAKTLFDEYKKWCYEYDEAFPLKNRAFYRAIETRGFKKQNGAKNKVFFYGIGLNRFNNHSRVNEGVNEKNEKNDNAKSDNVTSINRKKL